MRDVISLSPAESYRVISRKEGGMGYVYILKRLNEQATTGLYLSRRTQDEYRFLYRDLLAAKAIKSPALRDHFIRELNIWIALKPPGIVPLLKVIRDKEQLLGIMPAYSSSLREYMAATPDVRLACLGALLQTVKGLDEVSRAGILHLDLKPENLLVTAADNQLQIDVSDWGIANIKSLASSCAQPPQVDISTIVGVGTVPYMSPERLAHTKPDVRSDIFSIGLVFYELIVGELPYHRRSPLEVQIASGEYMDRVLQMVGERRLPRRVAEMLHPDHAKRTSSYADVLLFLSSLRS